MIVRVSNERVADLIDYVEDPDELVAALHDLLDARVLNEQLSQGLSAMTTMRDVAERDREEARPVLEAARHHEDEGWWMEGEKAYSCECEICKTIRAHDAARVAEGEEK